MTISIYSHTFQSVPQADYVSLLKLRYKVFSQRLKRCEKTF